MGNKTEDVGTRNGCNTTTYLHRTVYPAKVFPYIYSIYKETQNGVIIIHP